MVWAPWARRRAGYSPVEVAATIPGFASTLSTSAAPKSTQTGAPSGSPQGPARAEAGKASAASATMIAFTREGVAKAADRVPSLHGSLTAGDEFRAVGPSTEQHPSRRHRLMQKKITTFLTY